MLSKIIRVSKSKSNMCVSLISVATPLNMLCAGAKLNTIKKVKDALGRCYFSTQEICGCMIDLIINTNIIVNKCQKMHF